MRRGWRALCVTVACCSLGLTSADAATYEIDQVHSSVSFKIRHLVSKVRGVFTEFEGVIEFDPEEPASGRVSVTIDAASINTSSSKRDQHLRSAEFFDVATYPTMTFIGHQAESGEVFGELTMHGVTNAVVLELEFHGVADDAQGGQRAGFSATTSFNRKAFGIGYNKVLDQGGLLLGEKVVIEIEIEARLKEGSQ